MTLRGYTAGEELVVSLTDDSSSPWSAPVARDEVVLRFKLQATLLAPPDSVHPVAYEELSVSIPSTRWLELLDQAGMEVGMLVCVSSPLTN